MFLRVIYRNALALATLCAVAPGASASDCLLREGQGDSCTPVVACLEPTGIWFSGRATGWNQGEVSGVLSSGARCGGTWTGRNLIGLGQAEISCDDGRRVVVFFTYLDSRTGTALGHGLSDRAERVRSWSGHAIPDHVDPERGRGPICEGAEIPIS
ncbi:MAG: hypothetical protein ACO3PW_07395 [Gemmobacter sp.]